MFRVVTSLVILALALSGCVTARRAVRERVDQEAAGNQGVIHGQVPAPTRPEKSTREYVQVDVDLDEMFRGRQKPVSAKPQSEGAEVVQKEAQEVTPPERAPQPSVSQRTYTVKPDQSLSRIAKEVYGDGSKWIIIYNANKDKIKNPDRIKAGTLLTIPEVEVSKPAPKKAEK